MKITIRRILFLVLIISGSTIFAQQDRHNHQSGYFSVTQRVSASLWSLNQWRLSGLGKGTAFRLQISKRLNTEWYADYIKTEFKGRAFRWDRHLTNSVMFYFRSLDTLKYKFHPFVSASVFCLDFTHVEEVGTGKSLQRFSFSQQFGLGAHYFITERADISLYAQYYNHLGNDIHIEELPDGSLHIEEHRERISLEGHMFVVFSVGYRIADLWGKKK